MNAMKYPSPVGRFSRRITPAAFAVLLLGPLAARAAECPESSPEDAQERRRLAKEWFSRAETAENSKDDAEAKRAYACSYKMVAHPFTAYNLARVSERSGDNELALKMFKAYLTLKPDAQEKEQVKVRIKSLEEKIAGGGSPRSLSEGIAAATSGAVGAGAGETSPTGFERGAGPGASAPGEGAAGATTPPEEIGASAEEEPPPKPMRRRPVAQTHRPAEPESEPEAPSRVPEWIIGGVAVGSLVAGVVYNLSARSKMSACNDDAANNLLKSAQNECDAARPMAYASYAFFGVAAAGAVLDTILLIVRRGGGSSSSGDDSSSVGLMWLPGGGGLAAQGRF